MQMKTLQITRRALLGGLSALALGAALALGQAGPATAADEDLTIFEWSGYEDPGFHKPYVEKHGESPQYSFFGDEEEAFNKLRAGFKADIVHPCSQSIPKWREAGLLKPIDTSRIEAWDDLLPQLRDMPGFQTDGKVWIVPVDWGNTALVYRTDEVKEEEVQSLKAFADPKFKGKVSIGDNVDDAYALAALATGVTDWTKMTDEQFQKASDFLRDVHKNVRFYWSDGTQLNQAIANGEVVLAWAWNESPTTLKAEGHPVEMKRDTDEGLSTWVCGFSLLKDGEGNEDKVYDYINAFLGEESAKYMVEAWGYGHANEAELKKVDQAVLEEKGYADVDSFFAGEKNLFQAPTDPELRNKMIAEFEKIKAGF